MSQYYQYSITIKQRFFSRKFFLIRTLNYIIVAVLIFILSGLALFINLPLQKFFDIDIKHNFEVKADINSWTFSTPSNYSYDSSKIEVSSSIAKLNTNFFDTNWNYRLPITITNLNTNTLYEYQVEIVLTSSNSSFWNHVKNDGGDVRFLDSDNLTQISFYFDEFDYVNQFARFWVKIPIISASSSKTIYLYYGNSLATDARDLVGTFSYTTPKIVGYVVSADTANQTLNVISLEDSNQISDGTSTLNLNEQQTGTFPASELSMNTAISATSLFYANGSGDTSDSISPVSSAGTEFVYYSLRDSNVFHMLSPWGNANVKIYDNGTQVWSGSVSSSGLSLNRDIVDNHVVRITSDIPILVQHRAGIYDSMIYYPATTDDLYGVPSNYFQIGNGPTSTVVNWDRSSGSTNSTSLSSNSGYNLNVSMAQGSGDAFCVKSMTSPIGVNGIADSDGGEAVTFLSRKELGTKFGANQIVQYIAVAAPEANTTCTVYNSTGGIPSNPAGTNPFVGGGGTINKIYFGYSSSSNHQWLPAGWKLECDKPVYAYFEKDTGSSSEPNDETQLFSYKQMRQFVYPTPFISLGAEELKYDNSSPFIQSNSGITYTDLVSFSESLGSGNQGSVTYQISNDGVSWYYFDGANWVTSSGPSDSNLANIVNTNLAQFVSDIGIGDFYFRAFLNSDGTQAVELDTITIDYSNNILPNIDAGLDKNTKDHTTFKPFSDAIFNDSDGTIEHAYYNIEGSGFVEIQQGFYPTLLDAVKNFEYLFDNTGSINCILRVEDDDGGISDDFLVVEVEKYNITWQILDAFNNTNLDNITISDTSGWTAVSINSPIIHQYDYGTYTTSFSRSQYSMEQQDNWVADSDKTITVYLTQTDGVAIETLLSYNYNYLDDSLTGFCWLQRDGNIVYDANSCKVNLLFNGSVIRTFDLMNINGDGKFEFSWNLTGLDKDNVYNLFGIVTRNGQEYNSVLPYSFFVQNNLSNNYNPNYVSTNTTISPYRENDYSDEKVEVSDKLGSKDLKIISISTVNNANRLVLSGFVGQDSIVTVRSLENQTLGSTISINNFWTLDIDRLLEQLGTGRHTLNILSLNKEGDVLSEKSIEITINGLSFLAILLKYSSLINLFLLLIIIGFSIKVLVKKKDA